MVVYAVFIYWTFSDSIFDFPALKGAKITDA
jgi:hypothetical protein